ncbi:MAG TPA: DUF4124 domain-containing protein [Casimicrobiaceae bacterium]|nr:DUF4124 domain-containing protein [Casimicrobiaceae bacterium]
MFAFLRIALPVAIAATFGLRCAHADIYTWVDASGALNVSNLSPPDDARVLKVVHSNDDAARKAETQALTERVRQLEDEVEKTKQLPPPMPYAPPPVMYAPPAPPIVQYIVQPAPPVVQYVVSEPAPAYSGCDPSWYGCNFGWGPAFYPSGIVVLNNGGNFPHRRRFGDRDFRGRPPTMAPMHTSLIQPLATPLIQPLVVPASAPSVFAHQGFHRG